MNGNDIEQAVEILKEKIPLNMKNHVKKIVIYGSCARGDYTENSDIDVAILTDCDRLQVKKYDDLLMDIVTDIAMETNIIVEYTCIPENEFMEKKAWYAYFKNIENGIFDNIDLIKYIEYNIKKEIYYNYDNITSLLKEYKRENEKLLKSLRIKEADNIYLKNRNVELNLKVNNVESSKIWRFKNLFE